jgi:hypothetical protein
MLLFLSEVLGILVSYLSLYYPYYRDLGRILVIFYIKLSLPSLVLIMRIVNVFVEFVRLGDPTGRKFDDGAGMTSTCYVLFWIVVVPASDPKDLFMERITMFTMQSTRLIWVGLVE